MRSAFETTITPLPPAPSSGLTTPDADFGDEAVDAVAVARHERARHVRGEVQRVELLVRVAEPARVVHDERAPAQVLEDEREVEVLRVERRVLADEDALQVGQAHVARLAHREVGRGVAHADLARAGPDVAAVDVHVARFAMKAHVPATLGGALEGERRVLVARRPARPDPSRRGSASRRRA